MTQKTVAAIDLGTNSFHLVVVRVSDDYGKSKFEILHRQREVVRISIGTENNFKKLSPEGIDRAKNVLKEFKCIADKYEAKVIAIATSAIREAENKEAFIELIKNEIGIEIQVVSGYEEARLIYLGVLQGINVFNKQILLIDIGGGSTELLIGKRGKVLYAASLKLGAVRLTQLFFNDGYNFLENHKEKCIKFIDNELKSISNQIKNLGFEQVIGTAGTIQAIAKMIYNDKKEEVKFLHDIEFTNKQLEKIINQIVSITNIDEMRNLKGMDKNRADIILAGALILWRIVEILKLKKITVSAYALREGIIINAFEKRSKKDIINQYSNGELKESLRLQSVIELAKNYDVDLVHANQVKRIALSLFDELKEIHKLDDYAREILEYAAILHDIGYFISSEKHHKHSYFIIKNSELVGFDYKEIELIANIARYHRKSLPKESHSNLKNLYIKEIDLIKKLSAILRMADGLEKTHSALINSIKVIKSKKNKFNLVLNYLTHPPEIELWAAERRKKVLENIFKIKLLLKLEKIG